MKILRKSLDLTQAESAAHCGFGTNTWSNYENGVSEPDFETAIKISKLLGVTLDELITQDLSNAHLMKKIEDRKNNQNAHLNAHPNIHLKGKKEEYYKAAEGAETGVNEPDEVGTWAILGQLKRIEEKIDQLRISGENEANK